MQESIQKHPMNSLKHRLEKRRDEKAKEFCKDWPTETYHRNDLTLFYEKGQDDLIPLFSKIAEELKYLRKNYELVSYEPVGGDGAPVGYLPYPAEWTESTDKAITELEEFLKGAE